MYIKSNKGGGLKRGRGWREMGRRKNLFSNERHVPRIYDSQGLIYSYLLKRILRGRARLFSAKYELPRIN